MLCLIPALAITIVYGEYLASQEVSKVIEQKEAKTLPLVSRFETDLLDTISLIEITSKQESVTIPPDRRLVSTMLHGVGENDEAGKRSVAKTIIYNRNDIDTVFFTMPNGDMYLIEPYQRQLDVVSTNFAFRDWYTGLIKTNKTYVSEVFFPQGKNHNTVGIVTPVKSASGEFIGIWGALVNLDDWTKQFLDIKLNRNEHVFLVDHNGNLIVDSQDRTQKTMNSLLHLKSVSKVLEGNSGTLIEPFHDTEMFVIFVPLTVGSHTWGIILAEPYSDMLYGANTIRLYYAITAAVMLSAASLAILLVKRNAKGRLVWLRGAEKIRQIEDVDVPSQEILTSPKKSGPSSKRIIAATIIVSFLTTAGLLYATSPQQHVSLAEMKTAFVIQNLRGDTIDTWVNWKIQPSEIFHIHVVDSHELTEERFHVINDVINSRETVHVDDLLLHKGHAGTSSVYYMGWRGALESLSGVNTKYPMPLTLHSVMTDKGDGHIVIRLSALKSSDGYSGYTKSYVDEENHQILKSVITIYDVDSITNEQLAVILRHEIGHGLGLGHSTAPEDLMAPKIATPYPYISECALDALVDLYNGNAKSQFVCEK